MLHWLAGQRPAEGLADSTKTLDPPETPAPVFAVRAFKHAIFGTPQTVAPKARRHSTTEKEASKPITMKPARPTMIRPKSANDAQGLASSDPSEPLPSPTKGILMTPGTAAARRKTVSFGDDDEEKKDATKSKSGLPKDGPGRLASAWAKPDTKPERQLSPVRKANEGRKSGPKDMKVSDNEAREEQSAEYWKNEYDVYRANTQREVKKLVMKQKAAKGYARDKDIECTELKDQLRQEKKKADALEKRTNELEAQLADLQKNLEEQSRPKEIVVAPALESKSIPQTAEKVERLPRKERSPVSRNIILEDKAMQPSNIEPPSAKEDVPIPESMASRPSSSEQENKPAVPPPPETGPERIVRPAISGPRPQSPTKVGRAVTSGTNLTPLQSLSVNAVPRKTSIIGRDGTEVTADRLAGAKARVEARRSSRTVAGAA